MAEPSELDEIIRKAQKRLEETNRQQAATPDELSGIVSRANQLPENQSGGFKKSLQVFLNHLGDAATFGGADALVGSVKPGTSIEGQRAKTQQEGVTNPVAAIAGDIAGTMIPSGIGSKLVGKMLPYLAKPQAIPSAVREGVVGGAQPAVDAMARGETPKWGESLASGTLSALAGFVSPTLQKMLPLGKISQFDVSDAEKAAMRQFTKLGEKYKVPMNLNEVAQGAKIANPGQINAATTTATNLPAGSVPNFNFGKAREGAREGLEQGMDWLDNAIKTPGAKPTALKTLPGTSPQEALKEGKSILEVVPKSTKPAIEQFPSSGTGGMVRDWLNNQAAGKLTERMQNPAQAIEQMGKRTPTMQGVQAASTATAAESDVVDEWLQKLLLEEEARKSRQRREQ